SKRLRLHRELLLAIAQGAEDVLGRHQSTAEASHAWDEVEVRIAQAVRRRRIRNGIAVVVILFIIVFVAVAISMSH
ncbi:MAG TPA: hypothetical protein VG722_02120, partial [Tepidisphaeraceae bacterium]|nr:hypothetical protein [Tepidisphaeraceae bacterium]